MGLLDGNIFGVYRNKKFINNQTYQLDSVGNLVTIAPNVRFKAIAVVVNSISSGAEISFYNETPTVYPAFYNERGELIYNIKKTGRYFMRLSGESNGVLRNEKAVSGGSCTLSAFYVEDVPESVVSIRPVQLIGQVSVELNSLSRITVFNDIRVADFKYYFLAYTIRNGSSAIGRKIKIESQPYHPFLFQSSNAAGFVETIVEEQDTYSFQTDWQRVRGDGLRVYFTELESAVTEGDVLYVDLYGVR